MGLETRLIAFGRECEDLAYDAQYQAIVKKIRSTLVEAISKQTGTEVKWPRPKGGAGDELFNKPLGSVSNLIALHQYAAHLDLKGRPPEVPIEDEQSDECFMEYQKALEGDYKGQWAGLRFKHLLGAGDNYYYLPLDFPEPIVIELSGGAPVEGTFYFGSSHRLLAELEEVNKHLGVKGHFGELGEEAAWRYHDDESDPWRGARWCWLLLRWLARESVGRNLCLKIQ